MPLRVSLMNNFELAVSVPHQATLLPEHGVFPKTIQLQLRELFMTTENSMPTLSKTIFRVRVRVRD